MNQEALGEVPCSNPRGIEFLHLFEDPLDFVRQAIHLGGYFIHRRTQVSAVIQVADDFDGDNSVLLRPRGCVELLQEMLRQRGRADLGIEEMLALVESLARPGLARGPLRVVFAPLLLKRAGLLLLGFSGSFRNEFLQGGIGPQLGIHERPQLCQRRLQDMKALLHLRRQRLLERHLCDLLHACHISSEDLGTDAATASKFRANPSVLFKTIVIYSSKLLVGQYLLGKILKPVFPGADV